MLENFTRSDLQAVIDGDENNAFARQYPMYPLLSPGMPLPGPNFIAHAEALTDAPALVVEGKGKDKRVAEASSMLHGLYFRALYTDLFVLPLSHKGKKYNAHIVPGHCNDNAMGPKYIPDEDLDAVGGSRVMLIGKMPTAEDVCAKRNFVGPAGVLLRETLENLGVDEDVLANWYMCNLVRWMQMDSSSSALPQAWIKDCLPLLHQELRLYKPDYILCFGAEATKAVCGPGNTLANMIGRDVTIEIPLHTFDEEPVYHKARVMAAVNPSAVVRTPDLRDRFESTCREFVTMSRGESSVVDKNNEITLHYIYKERELAEIVDTVLAKPGLKKIAVDAEWHGKHPGEPGSYLRTIQFSHRGDYAAVVVLRSQGGAQAFMPNEAAAISQLKRLLDRDDVQIGGSFFSSDLPWLEHYGLTIAHRFTVPADINVVRGGNYPGGFDVALAHHAYDETGDFKLEVMGVRLRGAVRWDLDVQKWKREYLKEHKMKDEELEGYGECPDDVLLPYGGYDAAYTRQLMDEHCVLLNADRYGNDCWVPFHISMMAFPAFNEMGMTGIKVDRQRIDDLTDLFMEMRAQYLAQLRIDIKWPGFNPRSSQQCVEFLFGEQFSTKRDKETGTRIRVRPKGALSLYLTPVKSTANKAWDWVVAKKQEDVHSPSTDKEVCGILGGVHPMARRLRDIRLLDQVLKSTFRPPVLEDNQIISDGGHRRYVGGIAKYICFDDRVRSTFQQVKETGRASSARPPLQNISKKREDDYRRIFGDRYKWPIRSFIISNTDIEYGEPTVLVEADYTGAELMLMAVMAQDKVMLDHCLRSNLEESHPDYYDIHSNIAVLAFQLSCEPTKQGLASIGKKGLRVAAKGVVFGLGYGRGAAAIARQCQEEGLDVGASDAQTVIDTVLRMYPGIPVLQQSLKNRARNECWVRNCFGRLRRVATTDDTLAMGDVERQLLNYPMQSGVADAISTSLYHLYNDPRKFDLGYKIVLQIHDAVVLEVPTRSLDVVYNEVMPQAMVDKVSFQSCDLDGKPYPDSPHYHFGIDIDVYTRWGVSLTSDDCDQLGIDRRYGKQSEE